MRSKPDACIARFLKPFHQCTAFRRIINNVDTKHMQREVKLRASSIPALPPAMDDRTSSALILILYLVLGLHAS